MGQTQTTHDLVYQGILDDPTPFQHYYTVLLQKGVTPLKASMKSKWRKQKCLQCIIMSFKALTLFQLDLYFGSFRELQT